MTGNIQRFPYAKEQCYEVLKQDRYSRFDKLKFSALVPDQPEKSIATI